MAKQTSPAVAPLPLVDGPERWDCQSCGQCCRGSTIALNDEDLRKLRQQAWNELPEFRGQPITRKLRRSGGQTVLAHRPDGSCIFLTPDNLCRIHATHGASAKPAVCQIFPLQLIALDKQTYITTRRACPSAAADQGRSIEEHLNSLKKSGLLKTLRPVVAEPPPILRRQQRPWSEFMEVTEVLNQMFQDERFPMVRRAVHALQFCHLLSECRLDTLAPADLAELLPLLEQAALRDSGAFFQKRAEPHSTSEALLRQTAMHFVRSHPRYEASGGWMARWREMLASISFARGAGSAPHGHPEFPEVTFVELEQPLGLLDRKLLAPLDRYFATQAASRAYAIADRKRPLITSIRMLAMQLPLAMWLLRLASHGREAKVEDCVDIVVTLERGVGMSAMPRAAERLADDSELERMIAWYAQ